MLRPADQARLARQAGPAGLAERMQQSRAETLRTLQDYARHQPDLTLAPVLPYNPPLWELGHIGWFQDFWIGRHPEHPLGRRASAQTPRLPARWPNADALFDSARTDNLARWALSLPKLSQALEEFEAQLARSLAALKACPADAQGGSDALYFFALALFHEDMHHEAALYTAQALGIPIEDARWQPRGLSQPRRPWHRPAQALTLGAEQPGFAFDNELGEHTLNLSAHEIDTQVVRWGEFLPFCEDQGYGREAFWDAAGWAWRSGQGLDHPRHLRRQGQGWQVCRYGHWKPIDLDEPVVFVSQHEAKAWCRWAGRRLPSEAEWQAACTDPQAEAQGWGWGEVWEWTDSVFAPFPGFVPHPYVDYSQPWFGSRPVLRGGSFMSHDRMKHPSYRNYFMADRNDIPAGFRSCARD